MTFCPDEASDSAADNPTHRYTHRIGATMPTFHQTLKAFAIALGTLFLSAAAQGANSPAPVAQAQKPLVAVLEPKGSTGVTPMSINTARGTLQQFIIGSKLYRVVDRSRIDAAMKEFDFSNSSGMTEAAKKMGKWLAADYVCVSDLQKDGGQIVAVCSLIDVQSGEIHASATELMGVDPPDIKVGMERVAKKLVGMEVADAPERPVETKGTPAWMTEGATNGDDSRLRRAREAEELRRAKEAEDLRLRDRGDDSQVRAAKATVNKLMPYFDFRKDSRGYTCTSNLLTQWEKSQKAYYADPKNWMSDGISRSHYWWHSLFVEIQSGSLEAYSRYTYVSGKFTNLALNHNKLDVTVNGRTFSVVLAPMPTSSSPRGTSNAPFAGTASGGEQKEEGVIANTDVLRVIADARGGRVQIGLRGNKTSLFTLDSSVQEGIAQTMELYDAIKVLEAAGIAIQKRY